MPAPNKHDSNITGLAFAEESTLKALPVTPIWYALEPNSYSDFGGSFTNVARTPINPSRQIKKGVLTDLDATGGFNSDLTQTNMQRLFQGFFFADAREKPSTQPINGTQIALTSVVGATETYSAASGLGSFLANHLAYFSGFGEADNNGLDVVISANATTLVGTALSVNEATPPATAKIEAVGYQFPAGDASLDLTTGYLRLNSAAIDITTLGLIPGEWLFIGGDSATNRFALNSPGYARIKAVTADYIDFDEVTFTPIDDAGAAKLIHIFFGKVIKNESASADIIRRSYNLERQLGNDGVAIQSEYLTGAIPNELTINIPEAEKANIDLSFVALDYETRTGTEGIKTGTRVSAANENAYNTSNDVYRIKLCVVDPLDVTPSALFAYVTDANIAINNGVTPNKAIGVLGAFDASAGDFAVTGSLTAYFSEVAAISAIRNNSDVAFNMILASDNVGMIFDIPLMSLGGGRLNIEKDAPINLPIEMNAAENSYGHTLLSNFFAYLPDVAMPV